MQPVTAIHVQNLSKRYRLRLPLTDTNGTPVHELWALKDVSFEVRKGESVGIIGANGSGKSTLLKILAGVTKPTEGTVRIRGRMAGILDIGAGFHPELSGRENVFLNGQLLGFDRVEIKAKFDEIVAFSGIEPFIDQPVKHYSNGMYLRLAFSILLMLDTETILLDETFAAGDAAFKKKATDEFRKRLSGKTILQVSHNIQEVMELTTRLFVLEQGALLELADPETARRKYFENVDKNTTDFPLIVKPGISILYVRHEWKGSCLSMNFGIRSEKETLPPFGILVKNEEGITLFSSRNDVEPVRGILPGETEAETVFDAGLLRGGKYSVDMVWDYEDNENRVHIPDIFSFEKEKSPLHRYEKGVVSVKFRWNYKT